MRIQHFVETGAIGQLVNDQPMVCEIASHQVPDVRIVIDENHLNRRIAAFVR